MSVQVYAQISHLLISHRSTNQIQLCLDSGIRHDQVLPEWSGEKPHSFNHRQENNPHELISTNSSLWKYSFIDFTLTETTKLTILTESRTYLLNP